LEKKKEITFYSEDDRTSSKKDFGNFLTKFFLEEKKSSFKKLFLQAKQNFVVKNLKSFSEFQKSKILNYLSL